MNQIHTIELNKFKKQVVNHKNKNIDIFITYISNCLDLSNPFDYQKAISILHHFNKNTELKHSVELGTWLANSFPDKYKVRPYSKTELRNSSLSRKNQKTIDEAFEIIDNFIDTYYKNITTNEEKLVLNYDIRELADILSIILPYNKNKIIREDVYKINNKKIEDTIYRYFPSIYKPKSINYYNNEDDNQ